MGADEAYTALIYQSIDAFSQFRTLSIVFKNAALVHIGSKLRYLVSQPRRARQQNPT